MRPRHGAYNMRPVHEGKQLASSGRAGPAQRVCGSPCPRPDSEARAPAKNHHFAAWTPPASLSIQARRGGPLEPTGTRYRASARSPRARRNTAWRRTAMRGEPGGAAKDARGWRAPGQGRVRSGRGKQSGRVGGGSSNPPQDRSAQRASLRNAQAAVMLPRPKGRKQTRA